MTDTYNGTMCGLKTALTSTISAGAQTEIMAEIAKLTTSFCPDPTTAAGNAARVHTDLDKVSPGYIRQLRIELAALSAAVDAAPAA